MAVALAIRYDIGMWPWPPYRIVAVGLAIRTAAAADATATAIATAATADAEHSSHSHSRSSHNRYRAQQPFLDSLLKEIGMSPGEASNIRNILGDYDDPKKDKHMRFDEDAKKNPKKK